MIAFVLVAIVPAGCKKISRTSAGEFATAARKAAPCACSTTAVDTLTGVITSDLTLNHCTEYRLSRLVFVSNNATLTIEPGTRIEGLPGSGTDPGGGLVITRGSRIIADGTEECPIVFTSYRWDGMGINAPVPGDWSGVILLGNAPVNSMNPMIEGVPDYPAADANYGGNNCSDNSGVLRYVRIEYAGYELTIDNEINGLTLGRCRLWHRNRSCGGIQIPG